VAKPELLTGHTMAGHTRTKQEGLTEDFQVPLMVQSLVTPPLGVTKPALQVPFALTPLLVCGQVACAYDSPEQKLGGGGATVTVAVAVAVAVTVAVAVSVTVAVAVTVSVIVAVAVVVTVTVEPLVLKPLIIPCEQNEAHMGASPVLLQYEVQRGALPMLEQ